MTAWDSHLVIRAAALYFPIALTLCAWMLRRPSGRAINGAVLACAWNLGFVLVVNLAAVTMGLWRFDADAGVFLGIPIDLYLAWVLLWGLLPAIAFPRTPLVIVGLLALAFDLITMPMARPVLLIGHWWLAGELAGIVLCLLPAQLLARWTARDTHLAGRMTLQLIAFAVLVLFVIPGMAIDGAGGSWSDPRTWSSLRLNVSAQLLLLPTLLGVTAVQEFVTRGLGTPVPFDPPKRLVTTGIYAYVRNPMQMSGTLVLGLLGALLGSPYVVAAGLTGFVYSAGFAGWDENIDLEQKFGARWIAYRRAVQKWRPRWRPWIAGDVPPARLYAGATCVECSEVAEWFHRRNPAGLLILAGEDHPSGSLTRISYEPGDGLSAADSGVGAIARALEHLHFGWAIVGFALRLPGIQAAVQLLVDASGGAPRTLHRPARS